MASQKAKATRQLTITTALAAAVVALVQGCAQIPTRPPDHAALGPSKESVDSHVAAATRAAGTDLTALLTLCKPAPAARPPQDALDKSLAGFIARPAPPPGKAFENLYFVGADWVSAWAIKTSQGIILIDALNTQAEAATLIEGGMRKLGLDPAQIKYVIVTHGHGDHYGGASYLARKYRARVVMSDADWTMTETRLEFATPLWGAPPKRDISVKDGDRIRLGDTSVTLYLTPGHTRGTLSPVFDVTAANGQKHRAMLWGGTGFNFGNDIPRLDAYIGATQRMGGIVQSQRVDVLLSNHSNIDGSQDKLAALRQPQTAQAPNPFVLGTPTVERALAVMGACAQAQRDRFAMQS